MTLTPGTRLGPYEIQGIAGAGGMGEVYRATDTGLKRAVAIKVLPESLAGDADRLARFRREAEVLASLNHSHIAQIYGLADAGGATALVMELVEGPTLADRIAEGPMPVEEALRIAGQMADALDAAHGQSIIHRDLKPANVKVRPDGMVKVLDFGLAKALDAESASATAGHSQSPTLTSPALLTMGGVILGTAAYMSPEQARGKPLDRRADIWAFGCVLYEMLAGRRAFAGDETSDVLASVLKSDPDDDALPAAVTPALRRVLRRCLEKDRARRFRDIGDVRLALEDVARDPDRGAVAAADARRPTAAWIVASVLGAAVVVLGLLLAGGAGDDVPARATRSSIALPLDESLAMGTLAFSPDGGTLAFESAGEGTRRLCLRDLEAWTVRCLARAGRGSYPFFSPDGRRIGYFANGELWAISSDGSSPARLAAPAALGGSWARDGSIVFNVSYNQGLARIAAPGEPAVTLTRPDAARGELGHFWPQVLDDGRTVLFTIFSPGQERAQVAALRLDTGEIVPLVSGAVYGRYLPTGHLVFVRSNTLMAVPFDLAGLRTAGTPVAVLDDVSQIVTNGASAIAVSAQGVLAYVPESVWSPARGLAWVDRNGIESPVPNIAGPFGGIPAGLLALAPDDTRVAIAHTGSNPDVYLYELDSGRSTRLTFGEGEEGSPVWTPDGERLAYYSDRPPFDLYGQPADRSGPEEVLLAGEYDKVPASFSHDGSMLVFSENRADETGWNLMLLRLGGSAEPQVYVRTSANEREGRVSPGGTTIAYASNETGRWEVYVNTFPVPSAARPVSIDGGSDPRWARDGRTLFYRSGPRALVAVAIDPGPPLRIGRPERLFETGFAAYDVAADGRFLIVSAPEASAPRRIDLVQHWDRELARLVPTD